MLTAEEARHLTNEAIPKLVKGEIENCLLRINEAANKGLFHILFALPNDLSDYSVQISNELIELGYAAKISSMPYGDVIVVSWKIE